VAVAVAVLEPFLPIKGLNLALLKELLVPILGAVDTGAEVTGAAVDAVAAGVLL
jgi:hypothetical protein